MAADVRHDPALIEVNLREHLQAKGQALAGDRGGNWAHQAIDILWRPVGGLQWATMPETPLQLDLSNVTDTLILTPVTRVLGPDGARALTQAIDQAFETSSGTSRIQVMLEGVGVMTSGAIGALIVLHKRLIATDRRLELINPSPAVREAIEFLKLDLVFTISHAV